MSEGVHHLSFPQRELRMLDCSRAGAPYPNFPRLVRQHGLHTARLEVTLTIPIQISYLFESKRTVLAHF